VDGRGERASVRFLVGWLCEEVMRDERREMFVLEGGV
jgi:hypothetical protein